MLLLLLIVWTVLTGLVSANHLQDCRKDGFDPWQLACSTCDLLPLAHHPRCRQCCQPYRDIPLRHRPYAAAVVVGDERSEQLRLLRQDNWASLVAAKGEDAIRFELQTLVRPTIWFYQEPLTAQATPEQAEEVIALDGWTREDMVDMLTALLPDKKTKTSWW